MKISLFTKGLEDLKTQALVVPAYQDFLEELEEYEELSEGLVKQVVEEKEFEGKLNEILILRLKGNIKKIVLLGIGKREEFNLNKAREAVGKAAVKIRENGIKEFSFKLFNEINPFDAAYCVVEGSKLALYQFLDFKTQNLNEIKKIEQLTLIGDGVNFIEFDKAIKESLIMTDAVCYARDLQNKPSNIVTPKYLAEEAEKISEKYGLKCTILEKKDMQKLGMGGILAVNKGSSHDPKLIILEYEGGKETICFIGKGITFDAGGISIKSSKDMDEMKYDMSGGASVLGIMQVASILKLPYKIIGIIPAAENLPGGSAYKPGDIISFHNGKTAEIIDTDAEGRLILADALAYSKKYNPNIIIDFATLTGACVVSLGDLFTGMLSNNNELAEKLSQAGEKTGEQVWRMPLDDKYKEYLKSEIADIKNCGPRDAGTITAAIFLKEFVECKKWAHLDIAGTAWTKNNKDVLRPCGGTGVGVRLGIEFLKSLKK